MSKQNKFGPPVRVPKGEVVYEDEPEEEVKDPFFEDVNVMRQYLSSRVGSALLSNPSARRDHSFNTGRCHASSDKFGNRFDEIESVIVFVYGEGNNIVFCFSMLEMVEMWQNKYYAPNGGKYIFKLPTGVYIDESTFNYILKNRYNTIYLPEGESRVVNVYNVEEPQRSIGRKVVFSGYPIHRSDMGNTRRLRFYPEETDIIHDFSEFFN